MLTYIIALILLSIVEAQRDCSNPSSIDCQGAGFINCATCRSKSAPVDGRVTVEIDLSGCKREETISWICCRSANCNVVDCDGNADAVDTKCQGTLLARYSVPESATSIYVHMHDGGFTNGTVAVTGLEPTCGGGFRDSCLSHYCDKTVDLTTCGGTTQPQCQVDSDCASVPSQSCEKPICSAGKCMLQFLDNTHICRSSLGDCDKDEYCTGSSPACPEDKVIDPQELCRSSAGDCDVAEYCDGVSHNCPADVFKDSHQTCRASAGDCDVAEQCTGTSAQCPEDILLDSSTTCRDVAGPCDIPERCSGISAQCPLDTLRGFEHVCRDAAGTCDLEEHCTGSSAACPDDLIKPAGAVCRPASDLCDLNDVCTGSSVVCPADDRKDFGYSYKCGKTQYLCGVRDSDIKVKGNAFSWFDSGSCASDRVGLYSETRVYLEYPACQSWCIHKLCPNNKDLSNWATGQCTTNNGLWACTGKFNYDGSTGSSMPGSPLARCNVSKRSNFD